MKHSHIQTLFILYSIHLLLQTYNSYYIGNKYKFTGEIKSFFVSDFKTYTDLRINKKFIGIFIDLEKIFSAEICFDYILPTKTSKIVEKGIINLPSKTIKEKDKITFSYLEAVLFTSYFSLKQLKNDCFYYSSSNKRKNKEKTLFFLLHFENLKTERLKSLRIEDKSFKENSTFEKRIVLYKTCFFKKVFLTSDLNFNSVLVVESGDEEDLYNLSIYITYNHAILNSNNKYLLYYNLLSGKIFQYKVNIVKVLSIGYFYISICNSNNKTDVMTRIKMRFVENTFSISDTITSIVSNGYYLCNLTEGEYFLYTSHKDSVKYNKESSNQIEYYPKSTIEDNFLNVKSEKMKVTFKVESDMDSSQVLLILVKINFLFNFLEEYDLMTNKVYSYKLIGKSEKQKFNTTINLETKKNYILYFYSNREFDLMIDLQSNKIKRNTFYQIGIKNKPTIQLNNSEMIEVNDEYYVFLYIKEVSEVFYLDRDDYELSENEKMEEMVGKDGLERWISIEKLSQVVIRLSDGFSLYSNSQDNEYNQIKTILIDGNFTEIYINYIKEEDTSKPKLKDSFIIPIINPSHDKSNKIRIETWIFNIVLNENNKNNLMIISYKGIGKIKIDYSQGSMSSAIFDERILKTVLRIDEINQSKAILNTENVSCFLFFHRKNEFNIDSSQRTKIEILSQEENVHLIDKNNIYEYILCPYIKENHIKIMDNQLDTLDFSSIRLLNESQYTIYKSITSSISTYFFYEVSYKIKYSFDKITIKIKSTQDFQRNYKVKYYVASSFIKNNYFKSPLSIKSLTRYINHSFQVSNLEIIEKNHVINDENHQIDIDNSYNNTLINIFICVFDMDLRQCEFIFKFEDLFLFTKNDKKENLSFDTTVWPFFVMSILILIVFFMKYFFFCEEGKKENYNKGNDFENKDT